MSLTPGPLVKLKTRFSVYFNTLACGHLLHTPSSFNFFHLSIVTHTQMENFKLKEPGRHPQKLVVDRGPYVPPMEARSVLVQNEKNSLLGARNEAPTITL